MSKCLILSGGGSRGASQIGICSQLLQKNKYSCIIGSSVGALNAAILAQSISHNMMDGLDKAKNVWKYIRTGNVKKTWFPFGFISGFWKDGLYDARPLSKLIDRFISMKQMKQALLLNNRNIYVTVTNLETGKAEFYSPNSPDFITYLKASSRYPVFMEPIELRGNFYSDGGIIANNPVDKALELGYKSIDLVLTSMPFLEEIKINNENPVSFNTLSVLERVFEIITTNVALNEIYLAMKKIELMDENIDFNVYSIQLNKDQLPSVFEFDPEKSNFLMELGESLPLKDLNITSRFI